MDQMEMMMEYWGDPDVLIVPAGETDQIIEWLKGQTPDTWHQVVMRWNYDYGDKVLAWILDQDACDRGTAARVFLVEGCGHWLWEALSEEGAKPDPSHVCRIVLRNWHSYKTGEFNGHYDDGVPEALLDLAAKNGESSECAGTPYKEILAYEGRRAPNSKYESEDGKIVIAMDYWMKEKGYA